MNVIGNESLVLLMARAKSKAKAALQHSTLKGAMTSFFCKSLLESALRKDQ